MGYFKDCGESGLLVLKNHQLKVTPPNEFNDPFEFSPVVCNPNPKEYAEKTVRKVITEPTFFEANRLAFSHLKNFQEFQTFARANIALMVNMLEADTPKLIKRWIFLIPSAKHPASYAFRPILCTRLCGPIMLRLTGELSLSLMKLPTFSIQLLF